MTTIKNIFPSNSVQPMIDASMLQIIVIALLFGCGVLVAGEKRASPFATFISSFNEVTQNGHDLHPPRFPRSACSA